MFDPVNGAAAIREGMTYQPRTEAGRMYQQVQLEAVGKAVKACYACYWCWQQGVDIAGRYSPTLAHWCKQHQPLFGVALAQKPTLQTGTTSKQYIRRNASANDC